VRLRGVTVQFGAQTVLAGIDLDIMPQDTLCVIGESGCGKTVLLKLIVGLLQPTERGGVPRRQTAARAVGTRADATPVRG
jgi:ABC-type transporter Mla maintaining outer membrane lipid asymmetry ATPase subunit MlaF